jgi:hypothetical protein
MRPMRIVRLASLICVCSPSSLRAVEASVVVSAIAIATRTHVMRMSGSGLMAFGFGPLQKTIEEKYDGAYTQ